MMLSRGYRSRSGSRPDAAAPLAPDPPSRVSSPTISLAGAAEAANGSGSPIASTSAIAPTVPSSPPLEPRRSSLPIQIATSTSATSPLRSMFQPPTPAKESRTAFIADSDLESPLSSSPQTAAGVYHPIAFERTSAGRAAAGANPAPQPTGVPLVTTRTGSPTSPEPPTLVPPAPSRPYSRRYTSPKPPTSPHRASSTANDPPQPTALSRSASPYSPGLGQHLFESGLLNSQLSDVNILCFGRIYKLHRLVLAQVDFFAQLLDGEWREAAVEAGRRADDDCIRLVFDQNVTRAAWEFCVATIYGGGPELVPLPWSRVEGEPLLLGRTFAMLQREVLGAAAVDHFNGADENAAWTRFLPQHSPLRVGSPLAHHPTGSVQAATPNFLLSLLACASYLGMTPLVASTTAMIQDTLTPFTVLTYLDFAQGRGVQMSSEERDAPCAMLGNISILAAPGTPASTVLSAAADGSRSSPMHEAASDEEDGSGSHCVKESSGNVGGSRPQSSTGSVGSMFYGEPAERMGEACACWLAKWGADVLPVEEALERTSGGLPRDDDGLEAGPQEAAVVGAMPWLARPKLALWGVDGLEGRWVRGLVGSDAFFMGMDVRGIGEGPGAVGTGGEWERYGFAKRVAELRQSQQTAREHTTDDPEIASLFDEGIYYSHLSFAELVALSADRSSVTGRPLVSTARLQRAHWEATQFRHTVPQSLTTTASALGVTMPSNPSMQHLGSGNGDEAPLELGCAKALAAPDASSDFPTKPFYVVPVDRTCRLNDAALGGPDHVASANANGPLTNRIYIDGEPFFGLGREVILGSLDASQTSIVPDGAVSSRVGNEEEVRAARQFNVYEPCRFSVEFFDVQQLKDRQRVYSHSHFYGGSLFNCYLQVVRNQKRSSLQLGLYLHRQAMLEAPPAPSRPSWASQATSNHVPLVGTHSVFGEGSRLRSAMNAASPQLTTSTLPGGAFATQAGIARAPYVDKRKAVQAYFAVHSPTLRGTAATLFASGPDAFANSQSWGYRSSSLLSPEYIGTGASALGGAAGKVPAKGTPGRYSSLRCTVTIGLS